MKSVTVEDLFSGGKISRKTYSTLVKARLRNAFDLKRYQSGLPRLFKTGTSGIKEITTLLAELEVTDKLPDTPFTLFPSPEPQMSKGEMLLERLTEEQLDMLGIVFKKMIQKMLKTHERNNTRVANVLKPMPVSTFVRDFLLEDDERILMLSDVGEASLPQLSQIKKTLMEAVEGFEDDTVPVSFKILALHAGGLLDNDDFVLQYFKEYMRLPVVYLVQKAVMENKSQQTFMAFLQRYDIFQGAVDVDMSKIDKTSFTISTYSNTVYDALFTYGASTEILGDFVSELMADTVNTAYLNNFFGGDFIAEDDPQVGNVIADEHLIMHPRCVLAIIGKMLAEKYTVLGGYTRNMGKALEGRWKNCYLMAKDLADDFDTERELWLFRDSVVKPSTEKSSVDIKDYLEARVEQSGQFFNIERLAEPFKKMVVTELELEVDEQGLVIVPKKRDKALADRLYIILENKKQPMLLEDLTNEINSGDGRRYVRASVSLTLNKDKRFQGSGKKGYYALREWQLPFFGSNADIVREVLENSETPMKADEIVAILKEYPYNKQFSKGDLSSVVMLGKNAFVKFESGFVGLGDKTYPEEFVPKKKAENENNVVEETPQDSQPVAVEQLTTVPVEPIPDEVTDSIPAEPEEPQPAEAEVIQPIEAEEPQPAEAEEPQPAEAEEPQPAEAEEPQPAESEEIQPAESEEPQPTESEEIQPAEAEDPQPAEPVASPEVETPAAKTEENSNGEVDVDSNAEDESDNNTPQAVVSVTPNDPIKEWKEKMQLVWQFVRDNGREPLEMFTAEVEMARWLKIQKQACRQNALPAELKSELLQLRDYLW